MTSMRSNALATCALVALALVNCSLALRSGAPSLACLNMRPLHGLNQAKPASASQFFLHQSALSYAPGQNVTVEITTHSSERYFRGFMVQSYDPLNGQRIGEFVGNELAKPMGCSSATHRDNKDKTHVSIVWIPPADTPADSTPGGGPPIGPMSPALSAALGSWLGGMQKRHLPPPTTPSPQTRLRKVRFRATIVVSYSEFYAHFESSERKFEAFDYSPQLPAAAPAASSQARGMVSVAVAVSPRANTTAIAIANSKKGSDDGDRDQDHPLGQSQLRDQRPLPLAAALERSDRLSQANLPLATQ